MVVTYSRIFPASPPNDCQWLVGTISVTEQLWVNDATQRLDSVIREAAIEAGVEYVEVYRALEGHELRAPGRVFRCILGWINGVTLVGGGRVWNPQEGFHPDRKGQECLAEAVRAYFDTRQALAEPCDP